MSRTCLRLTKILDVEHKFTILHAPEEYILRLNASVLRFSVLLHSTTPKRQTICSGQSNKRNTLEIERRVSAWVIKCFIKRGIELNYQHENKTWL